MVRDLNDQRAETEGAMIYLSSRDQLPDSDKAKNWKQVSLWVLAFSGHKGDTYSAQAWECGFI